MQLDDRGQVGGSSVGDLLANGVCRRLHLVEPRHQGRKVESLHAGRSVGVVEVADDVSGRLQRLPMAARDALGAAEIGRNQARARPDAGVVLLETLLVQVLGIEHQRVPLAFGEVRRPLEDAAHTPACLTGPPAPAPGEAAHLIEVGGSFGEPGLSVLVKLGVGLHVVPSVGTRPGTGRNLQSGGDKRSPVRALRTRRTPPSLNPIETPHHNGTEISESLQLAPGAFAVLASRQFKVVGPSKLSAAHAAAFCDI